MTRAKFRKFGITYGSFLHRFASLREIIRVLFKGPVLSLPQDAK
jgi:hypothetical protein